MKIVYTPLGLAVGASAAVLVTKDTGCCFSLTASGAQSGIVGQLTDGQNRVYGNLPAGKYCINNGAITDGQGRGCILTPPNSNVIKELHLCLASPSLPRVLWPTTATLPLLFARLEITEDTTSTPLRRRVKEAAAQLL